MSYDGTRVRNGASIEERLLYRRAVSPLGCWIWTGYRKNGGYGGMRVEGKDRYTHRLAYECWIGPIPDSLEIDHLCRNRSCFNPSHLEAVTPQVNVRRGASPGARNLRRTHCTQGHSYAETEVFRAGRRRCGECLREYMAAYRATPRDTSVDRRRKARAA